MSLSAESECEYTDGSSRSRARYNALDRRDDQVSALLLRLRLNLMPARTSDQADRFRTQY
jgi:hypothetical protein